MARSELLQHELSNDLRKVAPGRAQYTHLLDPTDGSVLDDIIVWWLAEDVFDVMPNASNTVRVRDAIGGEDTTATRAVVAVQGPLARHRLATVSGEAAAVPRFRVTRFSFAGAECVAAGTGYTGEDGVECAVPVEAATEFWRALLDAGVSPAGLGARDTLRLEAGLPLHGHELGPGITPLQAGLGWVVGWDKGDFRGRRPLEHERAGGPRRMLRGLVAEGRQPPRDGATVLALETAVGTVTSGNFSPVLGRGIAMALLDTDRGVAVAVGTELAVDVRGRHIGAHVVELPFVGAGTTRVRNRGDAVSGYTPHTDADIASMLGFLGLSSLDELFDVVPAALRLAGGLDLPAGMPEPDVFSRMQDLAAANRPCGRDLVCFAGGGAYDHEVPPVTRALASRSEFVTSYTPYQPEVAQGVLQAVFEFQTLVARLSGMEVSNASLYDGAASLVEAVNLAYGATGRQDVWVSHGVNPTWRDVLMTFAAGTGHRVHDVPLAAGATDWAATAFEGGDEPGAVVVVLPQLPRVPRRHRRGPRRLRPDGRPARGGVRPHLRRHPAFAGRLGGRRGGGGGPGAGHAAELRRPVPRVVRLHEGPRAASAGTAGGRDRRRRGAPRLRDDPACPRAGHPAGEGDLQRLHQPDAHGRDRGDPAGLAGDHGYRRGGAALGASGALLPRRAGDPGGRASHDRPRAARVRPPPPASTPRWWSNAWPTRASWPASRSIRATPRAAPTGFSVAVTERRTRAEIDAFASTFEKAVR